MAPPSTFASAAAGSITPTTPSRTDSGGDWARRTNGATQTFRRPSLATNISSSSHPRESGQAPQPGVYVPPHRNGSYVDTRYSKTQLLDLFRSKQESEGLLNDGLSSLFVAGWEPSVSNGVSAGGWNRRDEQVKDHAPGPEVCWDRDGATAPISMTDMSDEERELFLSVNSPLKPPTTTNKENVVREGVPLRKISISQGVNSPGGYGLNSPSTARPGARRRETQEAYPFPSNTLTSPPAGKSARDDSRTASPPPVLTRRRTDLKDAGPGSKADDSEAEEPADNSRTPFGNLQRASAATGSTGPGLGGPASPWASNPQAAGGGFSPMGAFGNFAIGSNPGPAGTPADKRPGLGGGRAESRFKGLMSKEVDDIGRGSRDQPPQGNREADDDVPSGSAALGGGQDISPPRTRVGLGTPSRQDSRDEFGFAAFGMTSDTPSFRNLMHQQEQFHHTPQSRGQPQPSHGGNEPLSPSDTNPYQSPEQHGTEPDDVDTDGSDLHNAHLPGLGGYMNESMPGMPSMSGYAGIPNLQVGRGPAAPPSDRSQTSSVGPHRGFSGLSGLGAIPGLGGASAWGGAQGAVGTPTRERAGLATNFGDNVFGSAAEMQSPSLAGLGHSNFFGAHGNTAGVGRGASRLGSLFPQAMQEQMRSEHGQQQLEGEGSDGAESHDQTGPPRDTDSPLRANRGIGGDLSGGFSEQGRGGFGQFGSSAQTSSVTSTNQEPIGQRPAQPSAPMQPVSSSASNQPPAAQQKTMVMPDRMRWIYRDPQGVTQGPWSGLEMHDWYKAGFFSPELLVKKYEDPDYEPLAQLIRRIGNSREPFLVPQIGIPHGPPSAQPTTGWSGPVPAAASGAQPPFASSFPSFGTTLTADQQNALERRKQEEQYLMARQKEHLAQQQIAQRYSLQGQHGILPQQLHHHSSAHSLHSQPSFGSISSPNTAFQPSPLPGPSQSAQHVPGFFDNSFRTGAPGGLGAVGAGIDMLGNIREEEIPSMLDRLNLGRQTQGQYGGISQPIGPNDQHAQQVGNMLNDRSKLQQEQAQHDAAQRFQQDQPAANERLQQFQSLQEQAKSDPFGVATEGVIGKPTRAPAEQQQTQSEYDAEERHESQGDILASTEAQMARQGSLSLMEQVQKAASAQQSPAPQSAWGKIDTALPQPFPPAPSQSPLPAPAAQRSRPSVADALHAESRSRSQTPSVDTPSASIAPWAKEPAEAPKGPSLREIQEAEAKVAAEAEAAAAETRRAAFEKELLAQTLTVAPAPGLPSSSTWASANTASPVTPVVNAPSPWVKAAKVPTPSSTAKSMAQIQKEEEARKKRVTASAAAASLQAAAVSGAAVQAAGKRYADLASKVASPVPTGAGIASAWTTVGASGKVKTPVPAAPAPAASKVVSTTTGPAVAAAAKKPVAVRGTTSGAGATVDAKEEFKKWAINELKHDLNKGVPAEEFISNLLAFPSEIDIITESVHSVSYTIDSRHFAEEFIRRRKLADKGLIDTSTIKSGSPANAAAGQTGGWSEVAKKGPAKEVAKEEVGGGSFKVVAAKKKAGKR